MNIKIIIVRQATRESFDVTVSNGVNSVNRWRFFLKIFISEVPSCSFLSV